MLNERVLLSKYYLSMTCFRVMHFIRLFPFGFQSKSTSQRSRKPTLYLASRCILRQMIKLQVWLESHNYGVGIDNRMFLLNGTTCIATTREIQMVPVCQNVLNSRTYSSFCLKIIKSKLCKWITKATYWYICPTTRWRFDKNSLSNKIEIITCNCQ